jgi:hypothetical protein
MIKNEPANDNTTPKNNLMNLLGQILGEPVRTKVRGLATSEMPIYVFNKYDKSDKSRIEAQACSALRQADLIAHHTERFIWFDIRNILFCQSFLVRHGGKWFFDENNSTSKRTGKYWELFENSDLIDFFENQWKKLEYIIYRGTAPEKKQQLKKKESLKHYLKEYKYAHRDELTFIEKNQPKLPVYQPLADNAGVILSHYVFKEGYDQEFCDTFQKQFKREFRENFKKEFEAKHVEEFKQREYMLPMNTSSGWSPTMHMRFYVDLLRCIGKTGIAKLMQDLMHNYKQWGTGIPDLTVYDKETHQYLLLECKGVNDTFRESQIRWFKRNEDFYRLNVGIIVTSKKQIDKLQAT